MQNKKQLPMDWGKSIGRPISWDTIDGHFVKNPCRSDGKSNAERKEDEPFLSSNVSGTEKILAVLPDTEIKTGIIGCEGEAGREQNRLVSSLNSEEKQKKLADQYTIAPSSQENQNGQSDQNNAKSSESVTVPAKKQNKEESKNSKKGEASSHKATAIISVAVISIIAMVVTGVLIIQKRNYSDRNNLSGRTDKASSFWREEGSSEIREIITVEGMTEKETAAEETTIEETAANKTDGYLVVDHMGNTVKMNNLDSAIKFVTHKLEFGGKVLDSDWNVVYEYYPSLKGSDDSEQENISSEQSNLTPDRNSIISDSSASDSSADWSNYLVKVNTSALDIRAGAGTNYKKTGCITDHGVYTIVAEAVGQGSEKGWGKLKSGAGWISLDYCIKLQH